MQIPPSLLTRTFSLVFAWWHRSNPKLSALCQLATGAYGGKTHPLWSTAPLTTKYCKLTVKKISDQARGSERTIRETTEQAGTRTLSCIPISSVSVSGIRTGLKKIKPRGFKLTGSHTPECLHSFPRCMRGALSSLLTLQGVLPNTKRGQPYQRLVPLQR